MKNDQAQYLRSKQRRDQKAMEGQSFQFQTSAQQYKTRNSPKQATQGCQKKVFDLYDKKWSNGPVIDSRTRRKDGSARTAKVRIERQRLREHDQEKINKKSKYP